MFNKPTNTLYAGIDLHKKYAYVTIMDSNGYIQQQGRFENQELTLVPTLLSFDRPIEATVESTYGWYWLGDTLRDGGIPFLLAHPQKVKAIVGPKKTDKEDSKALANLLRTNYLPTAYVPTKTERSMKELLRFRFSLVEQQSTIKRRLLDILAKQNRQAPYQDILGKKSKEWLASQSFPYPYQDEINSLLVLSQTLKEQIEKVTKEVEEKAILDENAKLLLTVPGIGKILALTLSCEIGDVNRFKSDRSLAAYAGVVPSVHSSGDKTHLGPTGNSGNPHIRWALAEALLHLTGEGKTFHEFYEKVKAKKNVPIARVAVMNKLIRAIYYMLIKRQPFLPNLKTEGDPGVIQDL